jgi:hypothetical protein
MKDDDSVVTRLDVPEVEEGMSPSDYLRNKGHLIQSPLEIPARKGVKDFPREPGDDTDHEEARP